MSGPGWERTAAGLTAEVMRLRAETRQLRAQLDASLHVAAMLYKAGWADSQHAVEEYITGLGQRPAAGVRADLRGDTSKRSPRRLHLVRPAP